MIPIVWLALGTIVCAPRGFFQARSPQKELIEHMAIVFVFAAILSSGIGVARGTFRRDD
jgi:hypothetical protein